MDQISVMIENNPIDQCHLLKLPGELRNRIYELTLVEDRPIDVGTWAKRYDHRNIKPLASADWLVTYASEPSILRACTKLRKEALPIFYGLNVFHYGDIYGPFQWQSWLAKLPEYKARMVKHLRIGSDCPSGSGVALWVLERAESKRNAACRRVKEHGIAIDEDAFLVKVLLRRGSFWTNDTKSAEQEALSELWEGIMANEPRPTSEKQQE